MTRTDWNDYDWQLIHEPPQPPALHMALDAVITDEVGAGTRPPCASGNGRRPRS